jgi:RNA-directed DNA polymerase
MRQKNQIELNLGTGAKGEAPNAAAQEPEARAATTALNARRPQGRRWKQ